MSNAAKSCDQDIPTTSLSYFDDSIKLFLDLLSNLYYLTFFKYFTKTFLFIYNINN